MAQLSDGWESTVLGHLLNGDPSPGQSTYWVGLATADFTDDYNTSAEVSTGNWSNYGRVAISTTEFTAPTTAAGDAHTVDNSSAIDFGTVQLTTSSTEVNVSHMGLFTDQSSTVAGDKLTWHSTLNNSVALSSGDAAEFSANDFAPGLK